ncbi:MAG: TauD/TfdA family dioxygenase [Novosphingobium sp.]|nr:TauD/TfdA family dioxygenase [Novosphingobium sp.]
MEFRPLHPDFGVEVIGFDVENGRSESDIAALVAAYDTHSMLLFRGADKLSHERHVELTSWFGPPDPVDNMGDGNFVSVLHNDDMAGSMYIPFHSDLTYTQEPIRAICLQAIELPKKPTSTTYVSGIAAWASLPAELQEQLADKTLRHFYKSRVTDYDWPDFIAEHRLRLSHPRTGRPVLFATEHHAHRILELDEADSAAMIETLYTYLYAAERKYEHVWQFNDLLMWDNIVLQHSRTEESDPADGPRGLQRVALSNMTLQQTIEQARARAAA